MSLRWLRDYADVDASLDDIVRALVETGTEVGTAEDVTAGIVVARVLRLEPVAGSTHGLRIATIDVGAAPPLVLAQLGVPTDPLRVITGAPNVREGDLVPYAPPGTRPPAMDEPLGIRTYRGGHRSPGMLLSGAELAVSDDAGGLLVLDRGTPGQPLRDVLTADVVLDVDVTTNRPDCLCHLGIARELAAAFGDPLQEPDSTVPQDRTSAMAAEQRATVRVEAPDVCPRFAARVVEDVRVGPSPAWMQERLRAVGMRPINNLVDVTNFVAHELGQPLHAFDLDKMVAAAGGERVASVVVRRARDGESLRTLDGVTRELHADDVLVCAGDVATSLAGVIGGADTAVDDGTRNVLLEAATWDGPTVRATSRRLNVRTDASTLFEKGLSDLLPPLALDRAARLMTDTAGGRVLSGAVDAWPRPLPTAGPITVSGRRITALLGTPVDATEAATVLARLDFAVEQDGDTLTVEPPHFRRDVRIVEDVVEEVGRMLGYDRVPSTLPGRRVPSTGTAPPAWAEDVIRDVCAGAGFDEAITYSFVAPAEASVLGGLGAGRRPIPLLHPLSEDWSVLRVTQLPGLCAALALNVNRGVPSPALFELGRVFWEGERDSPAPGAQPEDDALPPLPREPLLLSVVQQVAGDAEASAAALRGVQSLFVRLAQEVRGPQLAIRMQQTPDARAGRSALLEANGRPCGVLLELDAGLVERLGLRGRVVAGELNLDEILPMAPPPLRFAPPPRMPAIVQDLAVTVPVAREAGEAIAVAQEAGGSLLESAELYDEYRGSGLPEGRKGWTFRLTYRAADRTLTGDEAQATQAAIAAALQERCEAIVRS